MRSDYFRAVGHRIFFSSLLLACCFAYCEEPKVAMIDWTILPVSIPEKSPELKEIAKELKEIVETPTGVLISDHNPQCCFRVEIISGFEKGFILHIGNYGARLQATDIDSIKAAIAVIKSKIVKKDGKVSLPIGVFTNYKTVQIDETKK
jgi:hypothetical protein